MGLDSNSVSLPVMQDTLSVSWSSLDIVSRPEQRKVRDSQLLIVKVQKFSVKELNDTYHA